jgi:hypothetical protein
MVASPEVRCLISQTYILGLSELSIRFRDAITGSLPGPRLTVAEASESLFGLEDPGDQKRTLLPGDDPLLLRLGFFRMLRLSFF